MNQPASTKTISQANDAPSPQLHDDLVKALAERGITVIRTSLQPR